MLRPICEKKFRCLAKSLQDHVTTLYLNESLPLGAKMSESACGELNRADGHVFEICFAHRTSRRYGVYLWWRIQFHTHVLMPFKRYQGWSKAYIATE